MLLLEHINSLKAHISGWIEMRGASLPNSGTNLGILVVDIAVKDVAFRLDGNWAAIWMAAASPNLGSFRTVKAPKRLLSTIRKNAYGTLVILGSRPSWVSQFWKRA